jgi:ATP-dependent DNA helicase RecG
MLPFAGEESVASLAPPRGRPRPERLEEGVRSLPGVGPALEKRLAKLGLRRVRDVLEHRPRRYEAPVPERRIADLFGEDEEVAIAGTVRSVTVRRPRRRLSIVQAVVADESDQIRAIWFNQLWLADKLAPGTAVRLRGQVKRGEFHVRSYDLDGVSATADFAPVYPASEEVNVKRLRTLAEAALERARDVVDPLPADLKSRAGLPLKADALWALHRPSSLEEAERGRRRLAFDELLVLQLGLLRRAKEREDVQATPLEPAAELVARYREVLPFTLTRDQEQAIREIDADLARPRPMERLLQGDVGSGKTVVALYALLRAVEGGHQGALMAPTETLAEQHFLTLEPWCEALGVSFVLLTSSLSARDHAAARQAIAAGEARIAVGTHALIQEEVSFADLAVAVVDEQHRFGVEQRRAITGERAPHVLHMTATPIPRTLALTVYGDLAVSEIAKPPAGRKPVVTRWIPEERASEAYRRLRRLLDEGRQAYVVCPLIEESETPATEERGPVAKAESKPDQRRRASGETGRAAWARAAEAEAERLRKAELRGYRIGCLHGRLRPGERRGLMGRFKAGELDVLVSTTVIEVGVDVPNATVMIIQEADRFGLAQLHQLRGRVGRGAEQSYSLLVSRAKEELTDGARARLEALVETNDGFELAEVDLEIRGEGQLLGTRQSGLSDLRFTRLRADRPLLEAARREAEALLDYHGPLNDEVHALFAGREVAA